MKLEQLELIITEAKLENETKDKILEIIRSYQDSIASTSFSDLVSKLDNTKPTISDHLKSVIYQNFYFKKSKSFYKQEQITGIIKEIYSLYNDFSKKDQGNENLILNCLNSLFTGYEKDFELKSFISSIKSITNNDNLGFKFLSNVYNFLFLNIKDKCNLSICISLLDQIKIENIADEDLKSDEEKQYGYTRYCRAQCLINYLKQADNISKEEFQSLFNYIIINDYSIKELKQILTTPLITKALKVEDNLNILKNFFENFLVQNLKQIHWYSENEELMSEDLPDDGTNIANGIKSTDRVKKGAIKNIKKCGLEAIRQEFAKALKDLSEDKIPDALEETYNKIFQRELLLKTAFCTQEVFLEELSYVTEEKWKRSNSKGLYEKQDNHGLFLADYAQSNYNKLIDKLDKLTEEIISDPFKTNIIHHFLNQNPFLQKADTQNVRDSLTKAIKSVNYHGPRTISKINLQIDHFLNPFDHPISRIKATTMPDTKGYFDSSYSHRGGFLWGWKGNVLQIEDHIKSAGAIDIKRGNQDSARFHEYEDKTLGSTKHVIEITYQDEQKILDLIFNNEKTFAKICTSDRFRGFAESVIELKKTENQKSQKIDYLYQSLFNRYYITSIQTSTSRKVILPNIDKSGIVPIFQLILEKRLPISSLEIDLTRGSEISQEIKSFYEKNKDELDRGNFTVKELTLNVDKFLAGFHDFKKDEYANYEFNLFTTLYNLAKIGFTKVNINSRHDLTVQDFNFHETALNKVLLALKAHSIELELNYPFYFHNNQQQIDSYHQNTRSAYQIDKKLQIQEVAHIPLVTKIHHDPEKEAPIKIAGKGKQSLFSNQKEATIEENQEQEQEQEQDQEQEQEQDQDLDQNNKFDDEKLITRENIKIRIAEGKLKLRADIANKDLDELQEAWDSIAGGDDIFNDLTKNITDKRYRITKMTPESACMLLTYKADGLFSGNLNTLNLPQGFYLFEKAKGDNEVILDFDVSKNLNKNPFRLEFNPIRKYQYSNDPSFSGFDPSAVDNDYNKAKIILVNNIKLSDKELNDEEASKKAGKIIEKYKEIFDDNPAYLNSFIKGLYKKDYKSLEKLITILTEIKTSLKNKEFSGRNGFKLFVENFLDPINNNKESGFNFFLEYKSIGLLQNFCQNKYSTKELNLLFHFLQNSRSEGKNVDPMSLLIAFNRLTSYLKRNKIEIPHNINIKQGDDLRLLTFRIEKILEHSSVKGDEKDRKDRRQEIFNNICRGEISLAHTDAYYALYGEGFTEMHKDLLISTDKINCFNGRNLSYKVSLIELRNIDYEGEDFDFIKYSLLRHISTPVDEKILEKKIQVPLEQVIDFVNEVGELQCNDDDKKYLLELFAKFPPQKSYEKGLARKIYDNIKDNISSFQKLIEAIHEHNPLFADIANIAIAFNKEENKKNLINALLQIKEHDWRFYSRILENLSWQKVEDGGYSFLKILEEIITNDRGNVSYISAILSSVSAVPQSIIADNAGNQELLKKLSNLKFTKESSLLKKNLNLGNLDSKLAKNKIEAEENQENYTEYFTLKRILFDFDLKLPIAQDRKVLKPFKEFLSQHKLEFTEDFFGLFKKNNKLSAKRFDRKFIDSFSTDLNKINPKLLIRTIIENDFSNIVVESRNVEPKEGRRLKILQENFIALVTEKFSINNLNDLKSRYNEYLMLANFIAAMNKKFPEDVNLILQIFCSNDSEIGKKITQNDIVKLCDCAGILIQNSPHDFSLKIFSELFSKNNLILIDGSADFPSYLLDVLQGLHPQAQGKKYPKEKLKPIHLKEEIRINLISKFDINFNGYVSNQTLISINDYFQTLLNTTLLDKENRSFLDRAVIINFYNHIFEKISDSKGINVLEINQIYNFLGSFLSDEKQVANLGSDIIEFVLSDSKLLSNNQEYFKFISAIAEYNKTLKDRKLTKAEIIVIKKMLDSEKFDEHFVRNLRFIATLEEYSKSIDDFDLVDLIGQKTFSYKDLKESLSENGLLSKLENDVTEYHYNKTDEIKGAQEKENKDINAQNADKKSIVKLKEFLDFINKNQIENSNTECQKFINNIKNEFPTLKDLARP